MEFFKFSFDCLSVGDLITLIFIYEFATTLFTATSSMFFSYCMQFAAFRNFMKPGRSYKKNQK